MTVYRLAGRRIYVAGHTGMVGQALVRRLGNENCTVLTAPRALDLRAPPAVDAWFAAHRPDAVLLAAARVGGIRANAERPADFLYDNLMIATNVIDAAYRHGAGKLLLLGSSCIYPKFADQPIAEDALLTGPLEPTNEAYAIAKIAGLKLGQAYRTQYGFDAIAAMPTNLYGPGDNYDPETSHVLPALVRRIAEAKAAGAAQVTIWGTGTPRREFLHVDDLADACVHLLRHYSDAPPVNVGTGQDIAIIELAHRIAAAIGYDGEIACDPSQPDGTPRKRLDVSRLAALGWTARIGLGEGLAQVCSTWQDEARQPSQRSSRQP